MKRRLALLLALIMCMTCFGGFTSFAADNFVTSYAFAKIAGTVGSDTITVNVPYSTTTTYWDHQVQVSGGATFTTSSINKVDDRHYTGTLTVTGSDGSKRTYTVNINKNEFKGPDYSIGKAKSIRKNSVKVAVKVLPNDAHINNVRIVYYTKKNNPYYRSLNGATDEDVEITGLSEDTKYYYYLSIETPDKTYETSSQSFKTKKSSDTGTSNSSTNNSSNSSTVPSKGTNSQGPATDAKENKSITNEWRLENGKWYYYGADGFSKVGWFQVGDKWYYVTKGTNDLAMSCWKKINDVWYFFDASGAMIANNWVYSNNAWYWMGPSGSMLTSQEIDVGGKHYMLGPDGVCFDNKMVMKDGRWQYYKSGAQGLAINEVFQYNGGTYRADANGFIY